MNGQHTPDDWHPTRTSTLVVVLASLVTATALVRATDVVWPAAVGAVGAVTLAVAIWAAGWQRHEAVGRVVASVLMLPVGVGIVATTVGTVLVLAAGLFPVPSAADIPETAIHLTARAMVVTGAVATVFGAATATRGVLDADRVERSASSSFRTALPPIVVALLLALSDGLRHLEGNAAGPGFQTVVGDALREVTGLFFEPDPLGPHVPTFVLMAGLALLATQRGIRALPVIELVPENGDGSDRRERVEAAQRRLFWAGLAVLATVPVATVIHSLVPPKQQRTALGPGIYDVLAAVTTEPALRSIAWWLFVGGVTVAGVVWLLRRLVQSSPDRIGSVVAPFAGGTVVVGLAFVVADQVLTAALAWVAEKLPGRFGEMFTTMADSVVAVYGPATIVLAATALVLLLTALAVSTLWITLATGYVEERTAGATVASLALFTTAAFAGVLDVSNALVLAALVGAVLVWDAGEFGVTLGQEIGRRANTRRAELVHTTGTLAVGGFGAGIALHIGGRSFDVAGAGAGPVALGMIAVLGGLMLLVVALR